MTERQYTILNPDGAFDPMYNNEILVTAHRSGEEPWRLIRLERVIGYLYALAEVHHNKKFLMKIEEINDHKGVLIVTWNSAPSEEEMQFVSRAWESGIGDGVDIVEHRLIRHPIGDPK